MRAANIRCTTAPTLHCPGTCLLHAGMMAHVCHMPGYCQRAGPTDRVVRLASTWPRKRRIDTSSSTPSLTMAHQANGHAAACCHSPGGPGYSSPLVRPHYAARLAAPYSPSDAPREFCLLLYTHQQLVWVVSCRRHVCMTWKPEQNHHAFHVVLQIEAFDNVPTERSGTVFQEAFRNGPREEIVYLPAVQTRTDKPDYLMTVDVNPASQDYSKVRHRTPPAALHSSFKCCCLTDATILQLAAACETSVPVD